MTQTKKTKAAAARAEVSPTEERTVEWKGMTLTLPPVLPEGFFLDLALVQRGDDPSATFEMLVGLIGDVQFRQVRNTLENNDDVTLADVAELIGQIFEEYGTSEGESEASQDS
jgi:hypothetical protein